MGLLWGSGARRRRQAAARKRRNQQRQEKKTNASLADLDAQYGMFGEEDQRNYDALSARQANYAPTREDVQAWLQSGDAQRVLGNNHAMFRSAGNIFRGIAGTTRSTGGSTYGDHRDALTDFTVAAHGNPSGAIDRVGSALGFGGDGPPPDWARIAEKLKEFTFKDFAALDARQKAAMAGKKRYEGGLDQFRRDFEGQHGNELEDQFGQSLNQNLFAGVNSGNRGGSADRIRQRTSLAEMLNGRQTIAANAAGAVNDLRAKHQTQRLNLQGLIREGLDGQDAISRSLSDYSNSLSQARAEIPGRATGSFFGNIGNLYENEAEASGYRPGADDSLSGVSARRSSSSGTISG